MDTELTQRPDKRFATAAARAAMTGTVLLRHESDDGQEIFTVSRWSMTRELPSLAAVEAWLDRVGAPT